MDKAVYNYDLATKQNQINEYAYHNKMDTLFFLQIFLCSMLILCIFAYLARIDAITYALFVYIAFIILSIVILIFVVRYTYTRTVRDPNRWYMKKSVDFEEPVKREEKPSSDRPWWSLFGLGDLSGVDIGGLCDSYSKQK
jgi:hypothetical protein